MITLAATRNAALLSILVSPAVVGCSPSGPPSSGVVQFEDGMPVQSGSVEFRSLDTGERYASRVAPDGTFTLEDKDGEPKLPPGRYEAVVVQIVLTEDLAAEAHEHGRTVPRKYADYDTSGLRFTNRADRTHPILLELDSAP